MAEIQGWEPMMLLGRPVPDAQEAVLDDPRGVTVVVSRNGWGAFQAVIRILEPKTETDVMVTWPNAEPDHSIPEETVKAWCDDHLASLVVLVRGERWTS